MLNIAKIFSYISVGVVILTNIIFFILISSSEDKKD